MQSESENEMDISMLVSAQADREILIVLSVPITLTTCIYT